MTPSEHNIQSAFFKLCRLHEERDPRFKAIFAIPNGGKRDKVTGAIMKREGAKAGVLDVFVAIPSGIHHGLFIEFKRKGGKMTPAQAQFARQAMAAGFPVIVATDALDAFRAVRKYFEKPEVFERKKDA